MRQSLEASQPPLVVFDGECLLCNAGMQFIVERDPSARFRFASLQSDLGQRLANQSGVATEGRDATMLLVERGHVYQRSEAALRIARELGGAPLGRGLFRCLATVGLLVPRWLRDFVYNRVAHNRFRFGRTTETCWLPSDEIRRRMAS